MWLWRLSQRSELDELGLGRRTDLCGYELITEVGLKLMASCPPDAMARDLKVLGVGATVRIAVAAFGRHD